ncbi:MAG: caspase family protein [Caldilineaceae bacterium]|nr:caspase family protein [Caldilineaceae bacterium]HRJ40287.1 caspase family protein [Caldilineaceae bacterium]
MSAFTHGRALVIGVGGDLPDTIQDANAIRDILVDEQRCMYPSSQVTLLTGHDATRTRILSELDNIRAVAQPDDTVLFYFSGHGYQISQSGGSLCGLMPFGYELENIAQTWISGQELALKIFSINIRKLLLIFDCCHSGGIIKEPGIQQIHRPQEVATLLASGKGTVVLTSSRENEVSYGGRPCSAFTLALIEALCGTEVSKGDGYVYLNDLIQYTSRIVPLRTRDLQHPNLDFKNADNFPIAWHSAGKSTPIKGPFAANEIEVFLENVHVSARSSGLAAQKLEMQQQAASVRAYNDLRQMLCSLNPRDIGDYLRCIELITFTGIQLTQEGLFGEFQKEILRQECKSLSQRAGDWRFLIRMAGRELVELSKPIPLSEWPDSRILDAFARAQELSNQLGTAFYPEIVDIHRKLQDNPPSVTIAELMALYRIYSADTRDFIAYAIRYLIDINKQLRLELASILNTDPVSTSTMSLFRHSLLSDIEVSLHSSHTYIWPRSYYQKTRGPIDPKLSDWFQKVKLKDDPFLNSDSEIRDDLVSSAEMLQQWKKIVEPDDVIVEVPTANDVSRWTKYLHFYLGPEMEGRLLRAFPIQHILSPQTHSKQMLSLAASCAVAWVKFLAVNPLTFQELDEVDQKLLIELLYWEAGSAQHLCTELEHARNDHLWDQESQKRTDDQNHFNWLTWHIETTTSTLKEISPGRGKVISWLKLRPPELDNVYLIILGNSYTSDAVVVSDVEQMFLQLWASLRNDIHQSFVKFFTRQSAEVRHGIRLRYRLIWSTETLRIVLNRRIEKVAKRKDADFGLLFPQDSPAMDRLVAEAAKGSLDNLLSIGNRIIRQHARRDAPERDISPDEIYSVLEEWSQE